MKEETALNKKQYSKQLILFKDICGKKLVTIKPPEETVSTDHRRNDRSFQLAVMKV